MKKIFFAGICAIAACVSCNNASQAEEDPIMNLKLADYRPVSVFKTPQTHLTRAKFPVIDMHSHDYEDNVESIKAWADLLKSNNVEKIIIHTGAYGEDFDRIYDMYTSVSDVFELWCGFDMTGWGSPDFPAAAVAELERCYNKGARGVGELSDKGMGEKVSRTVKEPGLHFNDDLFVPLFSKCAELGMPVNCHLADPVWMYEEMDEHNDGYMNAYEWKIDMDTPGILGLYELVETIEEACEKNPNTTFIACHFINISHDYEYLSGVLDRHPNLYIDNSARHLESCVTPRATKRFYDRYSDRIVFGTDNNPTQRMLSLQWRILESEDEHFYAEGGSYHWPLHGIGLDDDVLKKVYRDNALKIRNIAKEKSFNED